MPLEGFLALEGELRDSVRLVRAGLAALQRTGGEDDFYHLPTLLLANGIERLLKVVLWLEKPGRKAFPETHRLEPLVSSVLERCFTDRYCREVPAAQIDLDHWGLPRTMEVLKLLGEFGDAARYHNLDILLGKSRRTRDPQAAWHNLRLAVVHDSPELEKRVLSGESSRELYEALIRPYVEAIERCVRALARLFTLGPLATNGKQFSGILYPFLVLMDRDLGKTAYCG